MSFSMTNENLEKYLPMLLSSELFLAILNLMIYVFSQKLNYIFLIVHVGMVDKNQDIHKKNEDIY